MTDTFKTDFLFKKSLGVPFTNPGAPTYTESPFEAYKRVMPWQIYSQEIPATASLVTLGAVTPVSGGGTKRVGTGTYSYIERYEDIPLSAIVSGLSYRNTLMADAIPPLYDTALSYAITVKRSGAVIPQSDASHPWFFDSDAGVLIFTNGANAADRDNKLTVSFWRYAGTKGLGSGGGAGGVGDASDGQLLYDNSGSVSGSSITYVPGELATYTYTGSAEKYTGIIIGTKTYADGARRYVLGKMQQLIPTADLTIPSYPRPADGFYGGANDLLYTRQPFNHLVYDPSHNIVTKTFYHTDGLTYALVAIGNRVAWRDASGADTAGWVTYDLPAGEIIYDVAYGVMFADARLMIVTESLRYMTVTFVSGQPLTFSGLTNINGRADILAQRNRLSGLYFFETAVRMTARVGLSFSFRTVWVPSRVFMVTYRRDTAVTDINSQRNVSVLQASCQAVSSTYSNDFTDAANTYYTNLMSAPLAFKYAPYGIMTLVIDSPLVNLMVGVNSGFGTALINVFGNVQKSRVFGFYQGNNIYNASIMSILAFINTNFYDNNITFYVASNNETVYNWTNGDFYNYAIYNLGDANNFITRTRSMRYHVISPSANRYTIFPYSSSNAFQPILIDFNAIEFPGYYRYLYPIDRLNYDCSNTLVVTHPYANYLLAAETPNVLSVKRYAYVDASNNTLEGKTSYPTYTTINGIVSYAAVPGTQQTTNLHASNVQVVTSDTTIDYVSKAYSYTNGVRQQTVTTTRTPALEINDNNFAVLSPNAPPRLVVNTGNGNVGIGTANPLGTLDISGRNGLRVVALDANGGRVGIGTGSPLDTLQVNGALRVQNDSTFLNGENRSGGPVYPGVINLGFGYGPQIRSIYPEGWTNTISLQFLTNIAGNDPTLAPRMHIAAPSGNVGIGTTAPGLTLDVSGTGIVSRNGDIDVFKAFYPAVAVNTGNGARGGMYIFSPTPTLVIDTQGPDNNQPNGIPIQLQGSKVIVSSNSGIGYMFEVNGKSFTKGIDVESSAAWATGIVLKTTIPNAQTNNEFFIQRGGTPQYADYLVLHTHNATSLNNGTGIALLAPNATPMLVARSDTLNVGVGTAAPSNTLTVDKNIGFNTLYSNPSTAQICIDGQSQRLYLGAYYTGQVGAVSAIQSADSFGTPKSDYPKTLYLNPRGGEVRINGSSGESGLMSYPTVLATLMVGSTPVSGYNTQINVNEFSGLGNQARPATVQNNLPISVFGKSYIWCESGFLANSDMRIKKNITEINDGDALNRLRLIEPSEYDYIDIRKGTNRVYGFIAQQVYKHFPDAAPKARQTIPVFYQLCDASFNESHLTLVDISNREVLASVIPGKSKVQIIDIANKEHTPTVIAVDASAGTLTFDISGLGVTEDASGGKMFLYGMEVDDFHTLNKDYLFTINFAATQEIDREVQRLRTDNTALADRVATLEAQVAPLDNRVAALETQVSTLTGQNTALQQKLDALLARLGITDL